MPKCAPVMDSISQRNLSRMANRLEAIYESGDYSDFVIECEGREFKVHKAIICPQSSFFKKLCEPNFKEGMEGRALLQETDPMLLEQAIRFLYTGHYSDQPIAYSSQEETSNTYANKNGDGVVEVVDPTAVVLVDEEEDTARSAGVEEVVEIGISPTGRTEFALQEDHPALMLNVRMYILADYLEIPLLKTEALERCTHIIEKEFEPARLIGPFQVALENTTSRDPELRSSIFQLCSEQREKVIGCTKLDDLLAREEPIAWRLLKEQDEKHCKRAGQLSKGIGSLSAEIVAMEMRFQEMTRELEAKQDRIDECVSLTQRWNDCRNCSVDFDAELERHRHTGEYFLRCKRCRCRHEGY